MKPQAGALAWMLTATLVRSSIAGPPPAAARSLSALSESLLVASWNGTRGLRASRYSLLTELEAGDVLQRGYASLHWKSPIGESWSLHLDPSFEARHDRTFDRDLSESRASLSARIRRDFAD